MTRPRHLRPIMIAATIVCIALATTVFAHEVHADQQTYVVQPHDTLSAIAATFGTTVPALMAANGLTDANRIFAGQALVLATGTASTASAANAPAMANTYTVQAGDTLSAISRRFGISIDALAGANNIANQSTITIGQQLVIPGEGGGSTATLATAPANMVSTAPAVANSGWQGAYVVQQGDTLSAISQRFGVTLSALAGANNIVDQSSIAIGQHLAIPAGSGSAASGAGEGAGAIEAILTTEAQAAGVDVALVKALAWQESGWQMVTAADGGMGVMQLMPDSVTWVSNYLLGYQIDPYNPTDNIRAGVTMLRYYLRVFGDVSEALAAYHQGMVSVQTVGISPETEGYIANILALQQQFANSG